ncbi:MAG TPA: hypothetical protein VN838_16145 [Bradyrhizobium sp.]|nr:hypothetical protein [Bradyrhizobium sp.]
MPEEVTAWKATDGVVFPTEDACRAHELGLMAQERIADTVGAAFLAQYPQPIMDMLWSCGYRPTDTEQK